MPQIRYNLPKYKQPKQTNVTWDNFRKGLNLLLRPTELSTDEYATGDNIMLVGEGVPTGRWGTDTYFSANATGTIRGLGTFKSGVSSINELLALTDQGYIVKRNGTGSTTITGQSYPSGSEVAFEQLGGYTYVVSEDVTFTRYDGTSMEVFATVPAPTGLNATNFSGASGTETFSWIVTAVSDVGETDGSTNVILPNMPEDLTTTQVNLSWNLVTPTGVVGYQIYRGYQGDELFLAAVGASTSSFRDVGNPTSEIVEVPLINNTGGVKSKLITKFKDRLLVVPADDPSKLMISGRYPNQDKFNWLYGGGYIYIDPDSGEDITGIQAQTGGDAIIVYKNNSHYALSLSSINIGNYVILDPQYQLISNLTGCSSSKTIQTVENDIFYFGRKGLYVTGYEPNFLNVIRTNEVSARIRPYLDNLSESDYENAIAMYVDNKYILGFPEKQEAVVYDRERGSFAGIWKFPYKINDMKRYIDGTGNDRYLIGSGDDNTVYFFDSDKTTDNGEDIAKKFQTNKEIFKDWSLLKFLKMFYIQFTNVRGDIDVKVLVEKRDGTTSSVKSFTISTATITGSSGWGAVQWGGLEWGETQGTIETGSEEISRYAYINEIGRLVQVEVSTTQTNANFELIGIRMTSQYRGEGDISSENRV